MFIALLTIAKIWKQPKCPSTDDWIKMFYTYTYIHMYIYSYIYTKMFYIYIYIVLSCFSHIPLFVTLWTAACQAPLSIGFSRKEYWVGWHCLLQRLKPHLMSSALAGRFFTNCTIYKWYYSAIKKIEFCCLHQYG